MGRGAGAAVPGDRASPISPPALTLRDRFATLVFPVMPFLRSMCPRAWLICLVLLAGPAGPGGAWHVATADALAPVGTGTDVSDPGSTPQHAKHAGPSCVVCQTLQGARAVLPTFGVLEIPPPQAAPAPLAVSRLARSYDSRAAGSRGPPLA